VRAVTADPAVVLQRGSDIRMVRKMFGQSDVSATMIYPSHEQAGGGLRCPLDDLVAPSPSDGQLIGASPTFERQRRLCDVKPARAGVSAMPGHDPRRSVGILPA
jgi:hypothetical protein